MSMALQDLEPWKRRMNLTISNIAVPDYDKYKCMALNNLGRSYDYVSLGKQNPSFST